MPGENGMDVARELRAGNAGIEILFLTSSPEFAVESYEVRASNYLLKPVSQETLFAALTRCLEELPQKQAFGFLIQSGNGQYTRILYSRLMYAEAMLKSIRFYLDDHTVVSSAMTFTELVRLLDPCPDFVRPHRSYVVNMRYIENIAKNELVLMNGNRIPLSRNRSAQVSRLFLDFAFSNSFVEGGAFHDLFL